MSAPPPTSNKPGRSTVQQVVRALYDYKAQQADELSFNEGDVLYVLEQKEQNWWLCQCNDKKGLVPVNYIADSSLQIENPVHEAAKRGNVPFLQELLQAGVSINGLDKADNTPLHWAARGGHTDCVRLLLSRNPVLNQQNKLGDTPLHMAAWGGHADVVALLVQKGIDKTVRNRDGKTALQLSKNDQVGALLHDIDVSQYTAGGDSDSD